VSSRTSSRNFFGSVVRSRRIASLWATSGCWLTCSVGGGWLDIVADHRPMQRVIGDAPADRFLHELARRARSILGRRLLGIWVINSGRPR
jgi:hypothetical protein